MMKSSRSKRNTTPGFLLTSAITLPILFANATAMGTDCSPGPGQDLCKKIMITLTELQNGKYEERNQLTPMAPNEIIDHSANRFGFGVAAGLNKLEVTSKTTTTLISKIARDSQKPQQFIVDHLVKLASQFAAETPHFKVPFNPILDDVKTLRGLHAGLLKRITKTSTPEFSERVRKDATFLRQEARKSLPKFRLMLQAFGSEIYANNELRDDNVNFDKIIHEFWFNHFNVDYTKVDLDGSFASDGYEYGINKRMHSTFLDLLAGVIYHPAMLNYLDSQNNIFSYTYLTASNQNLGRELMELHTLGTGPGKLYFQKDVEGSAMLLTGLNVQREWIFDTFVYGPQINPLSHVPDYVTQNGNEIQVAPVVMGKRFCLYSSVTVEASQKCPVLKNKPTDSAVLSKLVQNRQMRFLQFLANHERTQLNICRKLSRRFVASRYQASGKIDNPNTTLDESLIETSFGKVVERCVAAWGQNGDLKKMYASILSSPEVWSRQNYLKMAKNPLELTVSAIRSSGINSQNLPNANSDQIKAFGAQLVSHVQSLGLPYRAWIAPTGYPSTGWMSQGFFVRWTKASFKIANSKESFSNQSFAPLQKISSASEFILSNEYLAQSLNSGTEQLQLATDLMGLSVLRTEPRFISQNLVSILENGNKIDRQKIGSSIQAVPLKTMLGLKLATMSFIRK